MHEYDGSVKGMDALFNDYFSDGWALAYARPSVRAWRGVITVQVYPTTLGSLTENLRVPGYRV